MPPVVTLEPILPAEMPALRNVWELYVHDFTEFVPREVGADGRFDDEAEFARMTAPPLELLWIRADGATAGFVFLAPHSRLTGEAGVSDVAQFFVLRRHRRAGVGRVAAALAFARRPGRWEVREMGNNLPAQAFWRRAIAAAGHRFEERTLERGESTVVVQSFSV